MISSGLKIMLSYVLFFWSIAWRTFALSIFTAILTGVGLAVLMVVKNFPPQVIEVYAPMVGLPITLLVGLFVVSERMLNVKTARAN